MRLHDQFDGEGLEDELDELEDGLAAEPVDDTPVTTFVLCCGR